MREGSSHCATKVPGSDVGTPRPIPVLRPMLPKAEQLLPYLKRIDEQRTYSNWGPLVGELSEKLRALFAAPPQGVVCANSGMSALVGAILACAGRAQPARPLAIVPDYTFTATALAVQSCGYQPVLASCHRETWSFAPDDLLAKPEVLQHVGLIVPVAACGRVVVQAPWVRFQEETGIPVVIDAAACFEAFTDAPSPGIGPLPAVLSFHATKSFATGEGGGVVTTDRSLAFRVLQALNFGFVRSRNSEAHGINGKMSEYAAAVGLAELDGWSRKQQDILAVSAHYARAAEALGLKSRLVTYPEVSSSYVLLRCTSHAEADQVIRGLAADRIDTRRWYGDGLHAHDVYRDCERVDLHGSATLVASTVVGLPMAPDLSAADVTRICQGIANCL
jgi:dTDP-4-amino-4,6-dideoxygalactose transaminase